MINKRIRQDQFYSCSQVYILKIQLRQLIMMYNNPQDTKYNHNYLILIAIQSRKYWNFSLIPLFYLYMMLHKYEFALLARSQNNFLNCKNILNKLRIFVYLFKSLSNIRMYIKSFQMCSKAIRPIKIQVTVRKKKQKMESLQQMKKQYLKKSEEGTTRIVKKLNQNRFRENIIGKPKNNLKFHEVQKENMEIEILDIKLYKQYKIRDSRIPQLNKKLIRQSYDQLFQYVINSIISKLKYIHTYIITIVLIRSLLLVVCAYPATMFYILFFFSSFLISFCCLFHSFDGLFYLQFYIFLKTST